MTETLGSSPLSHLCLKSAFAIKPITSPMIANNAHSSNPFRAYPWIIITCNGLFLLYKYILQLFPSVISQDLMQTFHLHGVGLGNLAATYFYSFLVTQLFSGYLLDRFSPRLLTTAAIALCAVGIGWFSQAHTLLNAECARILMGIGVAFATVSYLKQASVWFPSHRLAFVSGLLATAVGIGALAGQSPLAHLVAQAGWRNALLDCALLGAAITIIYFALVRDPKTPPSSSTQTIINFTAIKAVFKKPTNWIVACYSGLAFSPLAVFGGLWGNPFLESSYHLTTIQAAQHITLAFIGLGIGSPLLGWIADRWHCRLEIMISATLLSLISLSTVIFTSQLNNFWLSLNLLLFGIGTSGFMLGFSVAKSLNTAAVAATVIAMINTGDALFGAVTEPLVGALLDHHHLGQSPIFTQQDYQSALVILPFYLILALACAIWTRSYTSRHIVFSQGDVLDQPTPRIYTQPQET